MSGRTYGCLSLPSLDSVRRGRVNGTSIYQGTAKSSGLLKRNRSCCRVSSERKSPTGYHLGTSRWNSRRRCPWSETGKFTLLFISQFPILLQTISKSTQSTIDRRTSLQTLTFARENSSLPNVVLLNIKWTVVCLRSCQTEIWFFHRSEPKIIVKKFTHRFTVVSHVLPLARFTVGTLMSGPVSIVNLIIATSLCKLQYRGEPSEPSARQNV